MEVGLGFCGRDVPDRLKETAVVEPVHPFEGGVFDGFVAAPRAASVDDFGFEEAVDRLGERVVIAVADAAHGRFDARIRQPFGVFDRQILAAPVAMVNQSHCLHRATVMDGLFEGIKDKPGMRGGADAPTDDLAGIGIDDESHILDATTAGLPPYRPGRRL
jgi:hypothetical protein